MTAAYPLGLRTILRAGKTRTQPATFSMSEPRRGWGYAQAIGTDVPAFWEVTFKFTATEAQTFWAWFVRVIKRGLNEFTLPIRTEFGLVEHTCRFLPDGLLPVTEDGDVWMYRATIMARALSVPDGALDAYPEADPYWPYVTMLLHGEGANNGNVFTDSGPLGVSVARVGGTEIYTSTTAPKAGSACIKSEGATGRSLQATNSTAFVFSGPYTVDGYIKLRSVGGYIFQIGAEAGGRIYAHSTSTDTRINAYGDGDYPTFTALPLNAWAHFAFVRFTGGTIKIFIDGVLAGTAVDLANYGGTHGNTGLFTLLDGVNADIDEWRVTNGAARWSADFTPPPAPFPEY